jgi:pyridoxal phosphate enzyme (YggS family)
LRKQLESIRRRIRDRALACGRDPETIRLVAVSKTVAADRVREALEAGVQILGENYVQEAREKFTLLSSYPVSWHFIGHLQSNKAKYAVRLFDLIHSVDSLKLALELNRQAQKINKIQQILIQVNLAEEPTKSGAHEQDLIELITKVSSLENLSLRGLMTMPPFFDDPERARPFFRWLRLLRDRLSAKSLGNAALKELSMGMTGDFEAAIEEGATLVRIGTAIFGKRN